MSRSAPLFPPRGRSSVVETLMLDQTISPTMENRLPFPTRGSAAQLPESHRWLFLQDGAAGVRDTQHNSLLRPALAFHQGERPALADSQNFVMVISFLSASLPGCPLLAPGLPTAVSLTLGDGSRPQQSHLHSPPSPRLESRRQRGWSQHGGYPCSSGGNVLLLLPAPTPRHQ